MLSDYAVFIASVAAFGAAAYCGYRRTNPRWYRSWAGAREFVWWSSMGALGGFLWSAGFCLVLEYYPKHPGSYFVEIVGPLVVSYSLWASRSWFMYRRLGIFIRNDDKTCLRRWFLMQRRLDGFWPAFVQVDRAVQRVYELLVCSAPELLSASLGHGKSRFSTKEGASFWNAVYFVARVFDGDYSAMDGASVAAIARQEWFSLFHPGEPDTGSSPKELVKSLQKHPHWFAIWPVQVLTWYLFVLMDARRITSEMEDALSRGEKVHEELEFVVHLARVPGSPGKEAREVLRKKLESGVGQAKGC